MKQVIKKSSIAGLLSAVVAAVFASGAVAQEESGVTLTPQIGYYMHDNALYYDDNAVGGLGIGYQTSSPWGIELTYLRGTTSVDDSDLDLEAEQLYLSALYHFPDSNGVTPYVLFGGGNQQVQPDASSAKYKAVILTGGAGLKIDLSNAWSFRSELRAINDLDEEMTDFSVGLGLRWLLGAGGDSSPDPQPVSRTPEFVDEDDDGVADSADRCLGTAPGVTVDSYGCEMVVDTDGDGVPDDRDQCSETAPGARVDETGCYLTLTETKEIHLNVVFENNSSTVSPDSYAEIEKVVEFMTEYPMTDVVLEGHTDDRGAAAYNEKLSLERAQAVADVMIGRYNIHVSRIEVRGYGEADPLYSNDTAEGRAKNRRVTAKVSAQVESIQR